MALFLIIISALMWIASGAALWRRPLLSPAFSYIALLVLSLASQGGYPVLPLNSTILVGWLCMSLVVMVATMLQPSSLTAYGPGTAYMLVGALAGMAVGLAVTTTGIGVATAYGIMVIGTAGGTFFGYLLFTNTPAGRRSGIGSGRFWSCLTAKGFPAAITVMQLGVALVLTVMQYGQTSV